MFIFFMNNNNTIKLINKETLKFDEFILRCSIGSNGLSKNKFEGDKKTPIGIFSLGNLFYRKDKVKKPNTKLSCVVIKKNMLWSNSIDDKKNYNKLTTSSKKNVEEKIFRKDNKYDYMIPILYNYKNRILGKGSAIFIHLTEDYDTTEGCIALKKKDFLILSKLINPKTKIKIF